MRPSLVELAQSTSLKLFLAGALFSFGFSPLNFSGLTLLSLAFFYAFLIQTAMKPALLYSFIYGLGLFGLGVSWVLISIHDYGDLNYLLSAIITLLFIIYLSMYPVLTALVFKWLSAKSNPILSGLIFSAAWVLSEFIRSNLMTGFPWLLSGTSQMDSPLKYLSPLIGNYGTGFAACFSATLLAHAMMLDGLKRFSYLLSFVLLLLLPLSLKSLHWGSVSSQPISVAVIQPNLSMRDKWDESLFWKILEHYQNKTIELLGKDLIVMPESAIPLPSSYIAEYLQAIDKKAKSANSSIIFGLMEAAGPEEFSYKNSMMSLGQAHGHYDKRQLVPFGEYIPRAFKAINQALQLPEPNLKPGTLKQRLIHVGKIPVASLICYEIAYPALLRQQLPLAGFIVSISDNGWFGHSFASYQQLQMARMLSLQTARYQVLANNDGLSSTINSQGTIIDSLPPYSTGVLQSNLYSSVGETPWISWGDQPVLIFSSMILLFSFLLKIKLNR